MSIAGGLDSEDYSPRAAYVDRRMREIEASVNRVDTRLKETEQRLSGDVYAASISRRVRRCVAACAVLAIIGITGGGLAIAEATHVNTLHQEAAAQVDRQTQTILRALGTQNAAREARFAYMLHLLETRQLANVNALHDIELTVDPDYQRDQIAWRIMGSSGWAGTGGMTQSPYGLPSQQGATLPASEELDGAWPTATP